MTSKQTRGCCGGLCTLCNEKVHSYHSHPESLAVELRELLHNVANISTKYKSCICKACELNLRRGIKCLAAGNPYVPRWEKKHQKMKCCVPSCNVNVHVINHQFSWQMICAAVGIASINEGESLLPLCASHYQLVYRLSNPEKLQPFNVKFVALNANMHVRLLKSIFFLAQSHKWWSCF